MGDCIYRDHVAPMTKPFVPKDDFPIHLNCIDVQRRTNTRIDVLQVETIDDDWNMDGDKSLSELWVGVTRFAMLHTNPHNTTRNRWAGIVVKHVKRFTA